MIFSSSVWHLRGKSKHKMCSVADGDEVAVKTVKDTSLAGRKCMKCGEDGFVITRVNDAFCRKCFTVYVVHKFRACIGKSRIVRDGDQVLLSYSGGLASTALLHLVLEGLSERAHKKLRFKPTILHIDESSVLDISEDERKMKMREVCEVMRNTGFPSYISTIEQGLMQSQTDGCTMWPAEDVDKMIEENASKRSELKQMMMSMKSLTGKEDFIKTLRTQLILTLAKQNGYSKIMAGETNSRLAVNILNDITQGRGSQVAFDTGFCDNRYKDMLVLRPIRDLSSKEVAVYNQMNQLKSVFIPTLSTMGSEADSIDRLTEKFVTGLQADYFSTVSNIVRTGEKLGAGENIGGNNEICAFCQSPLDTDVGQASALGAVEFSQKLCKDGRLASASLKANNSDNCNPSEKIEDTLCFGCRTTFSEMADQSKFTSVLPDKDIQLQSIRNNMKDRIADCLLEDQSEND